MKQDVLENIRAQALKEIETARIHKQGKTYSWRLNEEMYYGGQKKNLESRANVRLSRMQEFVHTLLSKIDNPLVFKFLKRKNSQWKRVNRLNALRTIDQSRNDWDIKDIVGKKQAILYGRAVYLYYADSVGGQYEAHLEPVDVYDFLIDPMCGGLDIEQARYLGCYNLSLDKKTLEEGMKAGFYDKKKTKELLSGAGNIDERTTEENNKQYRERDTSVVKQRDATYTDVWKFWRWFTTYEGERYYLLMTNSGQMIRCDKLVDVLPADDEHPMGMWPFWSWACFPDLTEFWTPSYADYVREIFMAQDVSVNQMLDNAEAINKPQKVVNVLAIENLQDLKYRRDGIIKVKGDVDANRAMQIVQTPSIQTPVAVFNLLEGIHEKVSGVSAQAKGVEDVDGKVGIYEGNQAAAADRFGLLNKSYAFGYKRFAKLYELGVRHNLVRKVSIEVLGANGVEMEEVKKSDIFKKGDSFGVMVEASNAEVMQSTQERRAKLTFLSSKVQDKTFNQKVVNEMQAEIVGFTQDQIDRLMDTSAYGNSDILAEADTDIEALLLGENVSPNRQANNAYKQHIVNFMASHDRNLTMKDFEVLSAYVQSLEPIIMRNEARALQEEQNRRMRGGAMNPKQVEEAVPAGDDMQQPNDMETNIL